MVKPIEPSIDNNNTGKYDIFRYNDNKIDEETNKKINERNNKGTNERTKENNSKTNKGENSKKTN
ncbi:29035_t:CDS:2 [Gigaspora margarita]|uniref:29035_t:CDS:1 n=1 Tax=Gigaspora margarita TaxID=4874 RepID=A0ABM8W2G6_GIGMA|nr:29035_t:CDS:2 [Gigaspora margarita]